MVEPRLQYIYAVIDANNCCVSVRTSTYEVPWDTYILIPVFTYDYRGKYYDRVSGKWFYEPEFVTEFIPA
jgi:hypothetical protein